MSSRGPAHRRRRLAWRGFANRQSRGRVDRPSASAKTVGRDVPIEILLVGLEVGNSLSIGEVIEEVGLGRVDACKQGGFARVADWARRQACVFACVVWRVAVEL